MNNSSDNITKTSIPKVVKIHWPKYQDKRGFFHEVARKNELEKATGIDFQPVQWNHSYSKPKVIRALHTEKWNKLVYPLTGKMFAAVADVRPDSETFGKVETFIFDNTKPSSSHAALFLPKGIGNSICVMGEEPVHYMYLVDEYWDDSKAQGIAWDDPELAIDWPIKNPILSKRDQNNPTLRELFPEKFS